jgi:hypothetical protein
MSNLKTRLDKIEIRKRPIKTSVDFEKMTDEEKIYVADIETRCDLTNDKPDFSQLTVPELRRLQDIFERCSNDVD